MSNSRTLLRAWRTKPARIAPDAKGPSPKTNRSWANLVARRNRSGLPPATVFANVSRNHPDAILTPAEHERAKGYREAHQDFTRSYERT
jgi:hypothetical protein